MSNLNQMAKACNEATEAYDKSLRAELRSLRPMDTEEFWETIPVLVKNINPKHRDVKSAMHNLMCNAVYQSYGDCPPCFEELSQPVAWELMARFHNKYEEVKSTLSKKCWEMKGLERGDDGYGDLMDSLPLAGRAVVDGIMTDDIANYKQLQKALADNPLKDFILNGENYITMTLESALKKAYLSVARKDDNDGEYERDPDPHVVMITTAAKSDRGWEAPTGVVTTVRGPFRDRYEATAFAEQEGGVPVKLYGGVVKK